MEVCVLENCWITRNVMKCPQAFFTWMKSSLFWVEHGEHVHGPMGMEWDAHGCPSFSHRIGRIHSWLGQSI